ncbi:uncharacterized protein F4807DRAFT_455984 [Annulohypoxylon truncatum]|uniref:uncharacterized protein n=1 Tax=Annulohypoxylon truncatum TaxID=327061 RepID=UPI0020082DA2|nr:uncharacterized protein F4807DRAFT_455984 [Annulohypoxylon truncatum]KAI1214344.1 hypothetical protein F4807DRAFT_455984 [Annulohypoxylon truncatum]
MSKARPVLCLARPLSRIGSSFSGLKSPDGHRLPSTRTRLVSLIGFILCLLIGTVAAVQKQSPNIQIIISSMLVALVIFLCFLDILNRRRYNPRDGVPVYARNLGNTVSTSIVTLIAIPLLYMYAWYPALNQDVITTTKDTVDHAYFPSITLLQRDDWTSQGILDVSRARPKCFVGWAGENAPNCGLSDSQSLPCRCEDRWEESIENFTWHGTKYRTLTLVSSEALLCTVPTTLMLAQAFLWYDSSKAINDSSRLLSPSLWLAVYDPTLSLSEALENDYTRPILVNANGMVEVNLGLNYRQVRGRAPAYDYDISLSTIPALDMLCNIGSDSEPATEPCFLSLWLQFPTFERQVSTQGYAMSWVDVVASAGSWLSLFQIISWILSGLALQA